jgi:type VI secretion system protein ImpE
MQAEQLAREGRLDDALQALQATIRAEPAEVRHRVFLFQLYAVLGQWDRALTQLNVAAEMDPATLLMAQVGREALSCEALRAEVFAGERLPLVLGEPEEWVGWMVRANQMLATGQVREAQALREQAFEAAPAVPGTIDGAAFEWLADADIRLGPILEAIVDGRYYWVPFTHIREIRIEEPSDLRDLVWTPAHFTWINQGSSVGFIPARYPESEASEDPDIRLARRTDWIEKAPDVLLGLGQRLFASDQDEYPILATRHVAFHHPVTADDLVGSAAEGGDG